jgi:cell wall assembly regulator SMI1
MMIDNCGPKVYQESIKALEAELGASLPQDYREFLMQYNGGAPSPNTIDVPNAPDMPTDIQVFFGIGRSIESSNLSWNLCLALERFPGQTLLPIACDSGGNLFCLHFNRGIANTIIYCDLVDSDIRYFPVTSTFTIFLTMIRDFDH